MKIWNLHIYYLITLPYFHLLKGHLVIYPICQVPLRESETQIVYLYSFGHPCLLPVNQLLLPEDHGSLRSGRASESIAATLLCLQAKPAQASKLAAKAGTRSCTQPGHLQPRINADNKVSSEDKSSTVWLRSGFISSLSPSIVSAVFVTVYLSFGLLHFYSSTDRAVICYWMYRVSKRQCLVFTVASAVVSASSFSNLFFQSSFTVVSLCFPSAFPILFCWASCHPISAGQ